MEYALPRLRAGGISRNTRGVLCAHDGFAFLLVGPTETVALTSTSLLNRYQPSDEFIMAHSEFSYDQVRPEADREP